MTTTLSAFGVPLEPRPASYARQAAAPTRPLQRTEVARLLERIEARLESRDDGDAWKGASLAVSLYHAREQVEALAHDDTQQRGQGSTSQLLTSTAALRAKLQRLESTFQSRQAVVVNTIPQSRSLASTSSAKRDFLVRGLMDDDDDDDDDGDDEEEDIDPRILARIKKVQAPAPAPAAATSAGKEEEDEEMEAYEAASRARQKEKQSSHPNGPGKSNDDDDYGTKEKGSSQEEERPTALQSDRSLQDSLSGELLRMAGTLKANSLRFADALERDRKIVEEAGSKLEVNLTLMTRTRGKLGEYSKKARGMGWLTLGSVAVVCISWVIMFVVIKLT